MLAKAVKGVKHSPLYRLHRSTLSSAAPEDVWRDPATGHCLVAFRARYHEQQEVLLVFAVTAMTVLEASFVALSVDSSNYLATNLGERAPAAPRARS